MTVVSGTFNRTTTLNLDVVNTQLPTEVVVESRNVTGIGPATGGGYVETGTFFDSTSKTSAPKSVGIGARYSTQVGATATFRPAIPTTGLYNIYVTLDDQVVGFRNDAHSVYTINNSGTPVTGAVYLHPYTPGIRNRWLLLASNVPFNAGAAGTVGGITFTNVDGDGNGINVQNRFVMDAVKFVSVTPEPAAATDWVYE